MKYPEAIAIALLFGLVVAAVAYRDQLGKWFNAALGALLFLGGALFAIFLRKKPEEEGAGIDTQPPKEETDGTVYEDNVEDILEDAGAPVGEPDDGSDLSSDDPSQWNF